MIFFLWVWDEKGEKEETKERKKERTDACSEEQRKKSLFLDFFYGFEMRKAKRKGKKK